MAKTISWSQFSCKEEQALDSITKFGWDVKIKSIQENRLPVMWDGLCINYPGQNWDVFSMPSYAILSERYQIWVCELKSPSRTVK